MRLAVRHLILSFLVPSLKSLLPIIVVWHILTLLLAFRVPPEKRVSLIHSRGQEKREILVQRLRHRDTHSPAEAGDIKRWDPAGNPASRNGVTFSHTKSQAGGQRDALTAASVRDCGDHRESR